VIVETNWALERLGIPALWAGGLTGAGIRVGHLDTGVSPDAPLLHGRLAAFLAFDRLGFPQPEQAPCDSGTHGTKTARLICGSVKDTLPIGVAPDASLVSGMVIESGHVVARLLMGLDWMLAQDIQVLCLPLGIASDNTILSSLMRTFNQHGVLTVCSIGNNGAGYHLAPGGDPHVLSVGTVGEEGVVPDFSGSTPDILAPGVNIAVDRRSTVSGTSYAAALVAGVAALIRQAKPQASPDQIKAALMQTAHPLPSGQRHRAHAGLINPSAALKLLASNEAPPSVKTSPHQEKVIDPLLQRELRYTADDVQLEAAFIMTTGTLEAACAASGQAPSRVRAIPEADVYLVQGSGLLLRALLDHSGVQAVSSTRSQLSGSFVQL
jgi:subtilisin family serine protease